MFVKVLPKNIYIHLPFCLKKCSFCAFPVHAIGKPDTHHQQLMNIYLQYLVRQIKTVLRDSSTIQQIETVYIGGGTPSLFGAHRIQTILNVLKHKSNINPSKTQITVQMNVQDIDRIKQFQSIGVNRFSVGIQTFNSEKISSLNRYNMFKNQKTLLYKIIEKIKNNRPKNINVDFILDLNAQKQQINQVFQFVSEIKPQHITMYLLQFIQNTYLHTNIKDKRFSNIVENGLKVHQNYAHFSQNFRKIYDYQHYQISNFAKLIKNQNNILKSQFRSKHNQNYWKGNSSFASFGMGASSLIDKIRITRPKSLKKYFQFVQNLQKNNNSSSPFVQLSKQIQVHDESSKADQIQQIITSSIRRVQGVNYEQFNIILETEEKNKLIQILKNQVKSIIQLRNNIIDIDNLQNSIRLKIPQGFLIADQIGWRLAVKSQLLSKL